MKLFTNESNQIKSNDTKKNDQRFFRWLNWLSNWIILLCKLLYNNTYDLHGKWLNRWSSTFKSTKIIEASAVCVFCCFNWKSFEVRLNLDRLRMMPLLKWFPFHRPFQVEMFRFASKQIIASFILDFSTVFPPQRIFFIEKKIAISFYWHYENTKFPRGKLLW